MRENVPDDLLAPMLTVLQITDAPALRVVGSGELASVFRVTDLAVASMAAAACALARLTDTPEITIDRSLAAHWFGMSLRPVGWQLPALWDAVAGDYEAADGWIRLHTNARHHRAAALRVLDAPETRADVAAAVARWPAAELEQAVVDAGGAAAAMRSIADWRRHPQGSAVGAEPVVACEPGSDARADVELPGIGTERPLAGVRILDLTRVLAGPVATRLLAGWGADVLRIDPPDWDEPGVIPEVLLGKRTARLDLTDAADRQRFERLLAQADVLVHGYRADALHKLGFGEQVRAQLRPGLVDVALDAYGWSGPWHTRRGFDSLVQMSSGIADEGMRAYGRDRPTPLPVQAIDHATGYLIAAAALTGLRRRRDSGTGGRWRLSLARTAQLLIAAGRQDPAPAGPADPEFTESIEQTSWGPARRLRPPIEVPGAPLRWDRPARALGSDDAGWPA